MEHRAICKNGLEVFDYRNPNIHGFFVSLFLRAGCMYEAECERGITHFLEHILVRNVNKLSDMTLYRTLDRFGMNFNASTYSEMVQFYVSGASHHFSEGIDILDKLLRPIALTKSEVDAERRRIKAEIRENDDKSSLSSFSSEKVFEGTPLAYSITGTNKSVDAISAKRLEEYRKRIFTPENLFVYVTGNFTDADIELLCRTLGERELFDGEIHDNVAPVPQKFGKREPEIAVKNSDYTSVRFSFDIDMAEVTPPECDLLYDALFSGYNSPFFVEMSEEKGLFYDISGATECYRNIGVLHFNYELKEKNLYDALIASVNILSGIKQNLLSEEDCMKAGYVDNASMLLDDEREFNFTFAYDNHIMRLGFSSLEDRIEAYRAVTPERIRRAACQIFRPENLTLSIKANKKRVDTERIKEILKGLR